MDGKAKPINFINTSRNIRSHGKIPWTVDFQDQNHMRDVLMKLVRFTFPSTQRNRTFDFHFNHSANGEAVANVTPDPIKE